jgi:hypothetical protein
MRKTLIAVIAIVVMSFGSIALAGEAKGPVMLTDTQMDNVVAAGPHWGRHNRTSTTLLDYAPGDYNQATPNLSVGDVCTPRPYLQDRTNYKSNDKWNAYFSYQ